MAIKPSRRTVGMPSQRAHKDKKTGKVTKKPTKRLMQRRAKDTIPGYYPNPAKRRTPTAKETLMRKTDDVLDMVQNEIFSAQHAKAAIVKQAHVSRADGMLRAAYELGAITITQHSSLMKELTAIAKNAK